MIPGAVEKAPGWLKDAPFDVGKFFEMPPAAQNAAPLYLEAFFEFGSDLDAIAPLEVRKRSAAIVQRSKRADVVWGGGTKDLEKSGWPTIDLFLAEYKDGFRKLDLAQQRTRCVFAIGLTNDSLLPHAQISLRVVSALVARQNRALDRDEFDAALGDIGRILRISRDLRPRGAMICQLVSFAEDQFTFQNGISPFVAHRKLKVEDCDRLLKLLNDHQAQAIDPFAVGIKSDYILNRSMFREFIEGIKATVDCDSRAIEIKLDRAGMVRELGLLIRQINPKRGPIPDQQLGELLDQFALGAEGDRKAADAYVRELLAAKPTYADRARVLSTLDATHLDLEVGGPTLLKWIAIDKRPFVFTCAREQASLGAVQCWIALRRWQLTHQAPPTDLAAVCRAAKLPGVPVDPFSGSPLKLATVSGELAVYSVGANGVDDGAIKGGEQGLGLEGDLVYKLPQQK